MQPKILTKPDTVNFITSVWGHGENLTSRQFDMLAESLPSSELPILDRLLDNIGLLAEYNKANRPAFSDFRLWWSRNYPAL